MAKAKDLKITIDSTKVMYVTISKSKDGYNMARCSVKVDEKEYMSVAYEWEGDGVPGFAMDLMAFMQANASDIEKAQKELDTEFAAFSERHGLEI
jgi:hypothetical protein